MHPPPLPPRSICSCSDVAWLEFACPLVLRFCIFMCPCFPSDIQTNRSCNIHSWSLLPHKLIDLGEKVLCSEFRVRVLVAGNTSLWFLPLASEKWVFYHPSTEWVSLPTGVPAHESSLVLFHSGNGPQAVLLPAAVGPPALRFWFSFCSEKNFRHFWEFWRTCLSFSSGTAGFWA